MTGQQLDRDGPLEGHILRQVHHPHVAPPQLGFEMIPAGQPDLECFTLMIETGCHPPYSRIRLPAQEAGLARIAGRRATDSFSHPQSEVPLRHPLRLVPALALLCFGCQRQSPEFLRLEAALARRYPGTSAHVARASAQRLVVQLEGPALGTMADTALAREAVEISFLVGAGLPAAEQPEEVEVQFPPPPRSGRRRFPEGDDAGIPVRGAGLADHHERAPGEPHALRRLGAHRQLVSAATGSRRPR